VTNPAVARVLAHATHLAAFVVLLVTGLLLLAPTLRSAITGGHALTLGAVHRWAGVAFVGLPAAIVLAGGVRAVLAPAGPGRVRASVQALHVVVTVAMVAGLAVTGAIVWARSAVPAGVFDHAQDLHDQLTYAAALLLGVHLLDVAVVALHGRWQAAREAGRR